MQVKLKKQIHEGFSGASTEDLMIEKMIELPIAPQVGMNIAEGDYLDDSISCVQVRDGQLEVWLTEDKTLYHEGIQFHKSENTNFKDWENRKKEYLAEQWQLYKENGWKKQF